MFIKVSVLVVMLVWKFRLMFCGRVMLMLFVVLLRYMFSVDEYVKVVCNVIFGIL